MNVGIGGHNIIILFWKYGGCTVSFLGIHQIQTSPSFAGEGQSDFAKNLCPFLYYEGLSNKNNFQPDLCLWTVPLRKKYFSCHG
jgi:hypothetical protein